jgi:hypothetical protein
VTDPAEQETELAKKFYKLVETLVFHRIPTTFLSFPRFAEDAGYFADILGDFLAERFGISRSDLLAAHAGESDPSLIGKHST